MQRLQNLFGSLELKTLLCSLEASVLYIRLASLSQLNTLSRSLLRDLSRILSGADAHHQIKVIVILSDHPQLFSAGANIKEFQLNQYDKELNFDRFKSISEVLYFAKKPIVMALNGQAFGGGLELLLFADIILATPDSLLSLPQINLGLIPGIGGTQRLSKLIGRTKSNWHILTGEPISGRQAFQLGLVSKLISRDNFQADVKSFVRELQAKPLSCLVSAKLSLRMAEETGTSAGLSFERSLLWPLLWSEGASASLKKAERQRDK